MPPLGKVSEEWTKQHGIPIENKPIITINANGYVGATFVRKIAQAIKQFDGLREKLADLGKWAYEARFK